MVTHDPQKVAARLGEIVTDLALKDITVSDLKSLLQRTDYLKRLTSAELDAKDLLPTPTQASATAPKKVSSRPRPKSKNPPSSNSCIPAGTKLQVSESRVQDIYTEISNLDNIKFINAIAVLTRSFIEMSSDYYLLSKLNWPTQQVENTKLGIKMMTVYRQLIDDGSNQGHLAGWNITAKASQIHAPNYQYLHAGVHNQAANPLTSDLNRIWVNILPAIRLIWA